MEEKKLDFKTILGFVLIAGLMIWMMYNNISEEKKSMAEDAKKASVEKVEKAKEQSVAALVSDSTQTDSLKVKALQGTLGAFAYSASLPSAKNEVTEIKNEVLTLKIANKGGYIVDAKVNNFEKFHKGSQLPVEIIKNNNANLNIQLQTKDNRVLNTKDMYFEPTVTKEGQNQVLTMRLKAGADQFLEYRYVLKPNEYMMDFSVRSQGLNNVINTSKPLDLDWQLKAFRNEKSISYENRYTDVRYEYEGGKDNSLSAASKLDEETVNDLTYVAFKQDLFTSILLTETPIKGAQLKSENLVHDEEKDTVFTKNFSAKLPLAFKNGELNYNMNWYYGPADYKILNKYDKNLDEVMPLGWGIFGWINRYVFIPAYGFLSGFIPHGIAIVIFTMLVRLVMSPVTYKSYLSQAKMKVLRPEINELNTKYAKDPMKKQQETMKLYGKAGVNPMAGCLPALAQIPIFYALFQFFPSMFDLRQKSFLWADDLSSYDSVLELPFHIPFYGSHVSLFPILASIAIFFYMKMTTGDQQMAAPAQEGMPDMGKIMKIMIYISPIMMLFFFNNYASGLSLYYFISNTITIGIMLVIKNYIVDEKKIHAQIQENKTKDKPQSKFQKKMQEMMEQAEAQKKAKN
ncbi:putative inner membrane protein translocase component YidC [Flavobacterium cauense R2A-7]|uniref:Membrane protein insertase YidC n=1 Tax=Flavobacterium cauense R2A-7 TaxID=1341154 RepID=V6SAC4_9FLAO|nr:membrane protein insertase YidC [Flavobacterium cauense]ESU21360.1 putative inner membrane protein translocase component YidC [Flavobacterium cauense R2A-7]KGO79994.1 membrane protein [Flavobacterium cauense R2A-7]TWI08934.1 YidC/Oxa1 family membrane protein insertase [Flavobacterium cauense R2A-7]